MHFYHYGHLEATVYRCDVSFDFFQRDVTRLRHVSCVGYTNSAHSPQHEGVDISPITAVLSARQNKAVVTLDGNLTVGGYVL